MENIEAFDPRTIATALYHLLAIARTMDGPYLVDPHKLSLMYAEARTGE